MNPTELYSYKLKIESSDVQTLNDTLTELVTLNEFPSDLLPSVINAIENNKYILSQTLCAILIATTSVNLYQMVESKSILTAWDLAILLKNNFPAQDIETKLCEVLYKCFRDCSPLRGVIIDAMATNGHDKSLNLLRVIEYELAPNIPSLEYDLRKAEMYGNPNYPLMAIELKALIDFIENVRNSISNITGRLQSSGVAAETHLAMTLPETVSDNSEVSKVRRLIGQGESKSLEFKETLSLDVNKNTKEKYLEVSALKTIVAFLNTEGGNLIVGVSDRGEVRGLNIEIDKLHKNSKDKFLLNFNNLIKDRIGSQFNPYIDYKLLQIDNALILFVTCQSAQSPCYLDSKEFYVRTNPSTDKLEGPTLVEYIKNHFNNRRN